MYLSKHKYLIFLLGSLLFSAIYTLGYISDKNLSSLSAMLLIKVLISIIFVFLFFLLFDKMVNIISSRKLLSCSCSKLNSKTILLKTLIFLLSFIPVFIAFYPGILAYDSKYQYEMVLNGNISSWHTLAHMALFYWAYNFSAILGNDIPWALCTFLQMFILSYSLGFAFSYLAEIGVKKKYRVILGTLIFIFPVNHVYSISWTKDIIFAAFFLLTVIQFIRIYKMNKISFIDNIRCIAYIVGMMLFRNNAKYAFYVSIPFLIIIYRKKFINITIISLLSVILYRLSIIGLITMMHAEEWVSRVEVCSILLQQIANVYLNAPDGKELLENIFGFVSEDMLKTYDPFTADRVKNAVENNSFSANFGLFIKTWFYAGLKHPYLYIQAFIRTNLGTWYIPDKVHSYTYGRSYIIYGATNEFVQIHDINLVPWLRNMYDSIFQNNGFQKIPIIEYLFRPALYTTSIYIMGFWAWANKRKDLLASYVLMILYFGTVLLSPTALVRYVYCYMLIAPFIILSSLIKK